MRFLIQILKRVVGAYEDKYSRHKIIHCDRKWQTNYKQSKADKKIYHNAYIDSPGCPFHFDNRCCLNCPRLKTCKFVCQRGCFVWQYSAFGKVINERDSVKKLSKDDFKKCK
jgi:hypothetical protein